MAWNVIDTYIGLQFETIKLHSDIANLSELRNAACLNFLDLIGILDYNC